jgi:hypothetical protein
VTTFDSQRLGEFPRTVGQVHVAAPAANHLGASFNNVAGA